MIYILQNKNGKRRTKRKKRKKDLQGMIANWKMFSVYIGDIVCISRYEKKKYGWLAIVIESIS